MNRLLLFAETHSFRYRPFPLLVPSTGGGRARTNTSTVAVTIMTTTAAVIVAASSWYKTPITSTCQQKEKPDGSPYRLEVHLMDKIQQKSYLQEAKDDIPSTLRLLAIDLPELRTDAFSSGSECHLVHERVFVDDIAPPKKIPIPTLKADKTKEAHLGQRGGVDGGGDGDTTSAGKDADPTGDASSKDEGSKHKQNKKLLIAQKALVKSLVHCRSDKSQQKLGVELLEASVADLNRYELRKTHQFGNFKYDPGKYYDMSRVPTRNRPAAASSNEHEELDGAVDDEQVHDDITIASLDIANYEDEIEAPWNQYAWAEEMRLRITGQVHFDAPMEKSSRISRFLFGHAYKVTVPPVSKFFDIFLPKFARSDPDGMDGSGSKKHRNCRANNKPHAVIANGAALQRVPSALRLLQKLCRKADVPLFIIHDPRVWGGNTHQSLSEALKEMRSTIKNRVILKALQQRGSSAFNRGRIVGNLETETKWQIKERTKRAKELFTGDSSSKRKSEMDWSKLDSTTLEKKLMTRGLIQKQQSKEDEDEARTSETVITAKKAYSIGLIELAKKICTEEEEKEEIHDIQSLPFRDDQTTTSAAGVSAKHA